MNRYNINESMNIIKALDELNLYDWFINQTPKKSYYFWNEQNIQNIENNHNVLTDGHSRLSFAIALKDAHNLCMIEHK